MNFAVIGEHRDFFRKNQWIECENVLSSTELEKLLNGIASALSARLGVSSSSIFAEWLREIPANRIFQFGRDIWRENKDVKRVLLNRKLAEIASELIEYKPIRFGYDQLIFSSLIPCEQKDEGNFLCQKPISLNQMSCIQGILCGALICILKPPEKSNDQIFHFFPKKIGNIVFFKPDFLIPFDEIATRPGFLYKLIAYTKTNAVYFYQLNDPHTHRFKQFGYDFGDQLKEVLNPMVYQ